MATEIRSRRFLAKDFDGFRSILLEYARSYYGDKISDFSESSVGGIFLDMAAYVGDVLSFYLDHQFNELTIDTAIETENLEKIIKSSNIKIGADTPALVECTFSFRIPATSVNNQIVPNPDMLPIIRSGTVVSSGNGTSFRLLKDLDFSENTFARSGKIVNDTPIDFIVSKSGLCISGVVVTDTFEFGEFIPFRKITLGNSNVTQIISVVDSNGNDYFEVSSLADDVVFTNVKNTNEDASAVSELIEVLPAPYRFISEINFSDKTTSLIFGGGSAEEFEDDIIPDPSEFAISFPNTQTFSKIYVNPNNLINSKTLGISDRNTEISVEYSFGGGVSHNVPAKTVVNIDILNLFFPKEIPPTIAANIRTSAQVVNNTPAKGGENAPTIDELRSLIPQLLNSQARIVTKEDLLARIYTMPSNFGRVFRAGLSKNKNVNNVLKIFVVSRNSDGTLTESPAALKSNLIGFLEPYRLISDMIELDDAKIINIKILFSIKTDGKTSADVIKQNCINEVINFFAITKSAINKPININEIRSLLFSIRGVFSIQNLQIVNLNGVIDGRKYSNEIFSIINSESVIYPPDGGIFELKFSSFDVVGTVL